MVKGKNIVCQKCGKRFKTANALTQHSLTVHTVSQPTRRLPAKRAAGPKRPSPQNASRQRLSGEDRIAFFSLAPNERSGMGFQKVLISPQKLDLTRVQAHSKLWARWRPISLRVRIVAAGASTTFGAIAIGWSADPSFSESQPLETIPKRISALKPSRTVRLWESADLVIPPEAERKWYHTDGVVEESSHGCIVMAVESPTGGYAGAVGINIHLHWVVEFEGMDMQPESGGDQTDEIRPDNGWKHLFTTSDGSWDSDVLTLKMTSGGGMVPFSSAKTNHIYKPKTGTIVPYVKTDGSVGQIAYAVAIQSYATPGLAFCLTANDAKDYIKTGDAAKLVKYKAAGDWCTPDIPVFIGKPAAVYEIHREPVAHDEASYQALLHRVRMLEALYDGSLQNSVQESAQERGAQSLPPN